MSRWKDKKENQQHFALALIDEMEHKLPPILSKWTSDSYTIEEVLLETWEILLDKIDEVETYENPQGWIVGVAKNVMKRHIEEKSSREKRETDILEAVNIQAKEVAEEDSRIYEEFSKILEPEQIEMLKFRYYYRAEYGEIAKYYNIKEATCRKRMERIKKKIKNYYGSPEKIYQHT